MKLEIIKQEKNPFLQREELTLKITSESAPSASDVISELGRDKELTVIKKINTNFGRQTFLTQVVVYDNAEAKKEIETIPQKVRKKMEAEKKAAAETEKKKAAEEAEAIKVAEEEAKAAAEKPAEEEKAEEEKTEEVKEEEKTE
jgi:ribosomal protein S24E